MGRDYFDTQLELILNEKGDLEASYIAMESGLPNLDQRIIEAFRDVAPYIHPPKGLIEKDGKIRLRYKVRLVL